MSESEMKANYEGKEVVDSRGRKLVLKKPTKLDRYYLAKAMGEDAKNPALVTMMSSTLFVKSIDGVDIIRPVNNDGCLALLQRIGDEGDLAIGQALDEFIESEKEDTDLIKK